MSSVKYSNKQGKLQNIDHPQKPLPGIRMGFPS